MGKHSYFNKINWLPYQERIGNIVATNFWMDGDVPKPSQSHLNIPPFSWFGIEKFQPNPYYGKESEYEWVEDEKMYRSKQYKNVWISPSCFKNKETAYILASWNNMDHDECTPDLEFTGNRPFQLDDEELKAFWIVAKNCQQHLERILEGAYKEGDDDDNF
jgi:hypothetical protein